MVDRNGSAACLAAPRSAASTVQGCGKNWRRRFAKRFNLGMRRKSNVKNKTWEDTEPVLLRYFSTLRKWLQLDGVGEVQPVEVQPGDIEEEAEPDDVNPEVEQARAGRVFRLF